MEAKSLFNQRFPKTEVKEADEKLDSRITAVKEFLQTETENRYVSKDSLASELEVKAAGVVKEDQTIGENVTDLGSALYKETADRLGADQKQDQKIDYNYAMINQTNKNMADGFNAINKNVANGFTALNQADTAEKEARKTADTELNERITNEANAIHDEIKAGDTALNDRITNVKEYLEKQTSDNYLSKTDAAVQDGAVVKAANTIGDNVTNLDAALDAEKNARIWADKTQDKVIQQVNQNMVDGFNTINKNMADGFTALNQADAKEAQERAAADTALDDKITAETSARVTADTKLVEATNGGLSLGDGNVLQTNITTIDAATGEVTTSKTAAKEMILNKGNDNQITLNDKGIKVGTNSSVVDKDGVYTGGDTYNEAKAALKSDGSIKGADGKFTVNSANGTVNVNNQIELNGATGVVKSNGLNVGDGNFKVNSSGGVTAAGGMTTLASDGSIKAADGKFTVNSNGGVKAADGKFTVNSNGGVSAAGGMTTLASDGSIKAADGKFTVNSNGSVKAADGKFTVNSNGGVKAADGKITLSSDGSVKAADGKFTVDTNGAVKAANGNTTIDSNGNVKTAGTLSAADGSFKVDSTGKITSTGLDAGNGTIQTTGTVQAGGVKTGTLETTGDATIGGDLDVKGDLAVEGEFNAKTLSSKLDETNYTTINGGNVTSVNNKVDTDDGKTYTSSSKLTEKGRTDTAAVGNITNVSNQTATESKSTIENSANTDVTQKSYITQNLKNILQGIQNGTNATTVDQTETGIKSTATDGKNTASTNLSNGGFNTYATDGTNKTYIKQTATDIKNTAENGTISNTAKNLVNTASENMTNNVGKDLTTTVGGEMKTTVTGDVTEDYKSNLSTTVGGNQTTTVTGDSSLTAENINNEAKNRITNKALDVETDASSSIVNKVSNDAGSNTSTQLSYQTTEKMSQADGKTASYLRGAAEEKSQLTDGAKKTTIDTVAGQTNTNITEGKNISNNLQKADQVASSVTDGKNTTVVDQKAGSIASSITDGTKVNNTNNTVDKSEQLIKASDTQYSATTKTAAKMEDALVSGSNIIDVIKSLDDAANPVITSSVTDGTNNTSVAQTAKDITNTAKNGTITNDAKDLVNTASNSITDKVGKNVERTMGTSKTTESVKDGTKSNTFTKMADKDINVVTDGTNTSTESQLADSVNTSLKVVDAEGKTTQSLSNVKTVSDDTTKVTDITKNAFSSSSQKADSITTTVKDTKTGTISERSQTVSQVQDKVGTTTVTTTDGLTKLTNEVGTHKTEMDFAEVLKDLGVRGNATVDGNTTLGKEGADTTLTVNSTSTFNKDVTMKSNATVEKDLTVKGDAIIGTDANNTLTVNSKSTFNNGVTVKGGTTTDTLHVTGESTFDDIVKMNKGLSVTGGVTADTVTAESYTVKGKDIKIDSNGINAGGTKVTGLAPADISNANSTDAVSGGQLYETNTRVSGLETRMGTVETKVDKLDNKIDKVGANAAAMANLHPLEFDEDSKWNIAAAVGSSGSETASAVGVFYRPNENVMVNASVAMGTGENMFGGGVSLRLGHGGNKAKDAQMKAAAKENRELRAKVDDLTARMDALLSVLNPNMSKDFPDVPENHWAYEAVSRLAGNGIVEGYEDGKYHGERQMTRYEMAEIIYNALSKGAKAEKKLVEEFRPELQAMAAQKKA